MANDDRDPATGMRMGEKLRTYFLGVGVGLLMVAMLFAARWQMKARQEAEERAAGVGQVPEGAKLPTGAGGR